MNIINVDNEGLELVNQFLDPGNLSEQIILLEEIENTLQEAGYHESETKTGYNLYLMAHMARKLKHKLKKLRSAVSKVDDE